MYIHIHTYVQLYCTYILYIHTVYTHIHTGVHACKVTLVVSSWSYGLWTSRLLCPWDYPGNDTGVGFHALPQEIFLTQGWNPCLLHLLYSALEGGFLPASVCVCVSVYVYIHMFYFVFKSFRILEQLSNMNVAFSPLMMWCGDPSFCQQLFPWVKRWSVAYQRPRRAFEAVRYHYQSWSQDCVFEGIKHAGDGQMQVTGTVALP